MRVKEYNAYMAKKKLILMKLNMLNVDEVILNKLKQHKLNIRNKNILCMVDMVKKVLYDYEMFGKDKTHEIINEYDEHIYRGLNNDIDKNLNLNKSIKKIKLPFDDINNEMFRNYVVMIADEVLESISEKNELILQYNN